MTFLKFQPLLKVSERWPDHYQLYQKRKNEKEQILIALRNLVTIPTPVIALSIMFAYLEAPYWNHVLED